MDNERLNSVIQMAEAHLLNVQNELQKLHATKQEVENKIVAITQGSKISTENSEDDVQESE